jgi:hypothetical protein
MATLTGRDFSVLYFDDLDNEGVRQLRQELEDWRETNLRDPYRQFIRWVATVGHRDMSTMDLIASELSWLDLQRRSSAITLAALMGQRLSADSPAVADVLLDLVDGVTPAPADVVLPDLSVFRTGGDADNLPIQYEHVDGDIAAGVLTFTIIGFDGATFTAPATTTLANPIGAVPVPGAAFYYGNATWQFDANRFVFAVFSDVTIGAVPEYYDGHFRRLSPDGTPAASGTGVQVEVDTFLAYTASSLAGLVVRVRSRLTDLSEDVAIVWTGSGHTATTTTLLGQSVISTDATDYELSAAWLPVEDYAAVVGGGGLDISSTWTLPQDTNRKWALVSVDGTTAYWARSRVISVGGAPVGPASVSVTQTDDTTYTYMSEDAIQGQTVTDVLGTTTGEQFDRHRINQSPFIEGSITVVDVGGDTDWTEVTDFLGSSEEDKIYKVELEANGDRYLTFGDGTTGQIPPSGQLLTVTYRVGAEDDGNVGVNAIDSADAGLTLLTNIRNPREGSGWRQREGATPDDIDRLRRVVPGAYRAAGRAVTPDDAANLAVKEFQTEDGRSPFVRVIPQELGAGPKSVRLVCVGAGGAVPSASDIAELEEYLNGVTVGIQRFGGVAPSNQQYTPVAYTPVTVNVTVTATVAKRFGPIAQARLEAAHRDVLNPLATDAEGNYLWSPSIDIELAAVQGGIGAFGVQGLVDLAYTLPVFPVAIDDFRLPQYGTILVTVVEV